MSGVMMMIIAIVVLGGAYLLYGRYLQNRVGHRSECQNLAYEMEDGVDYVPADTNVVFGHQFASIAGAESDQWSDSGGNFWLASGPALDFNRRRIFRRRSDFASMYASVKNKGRTIGYIIEEYIGKLGKKLFLLFCWLFCILVVAALQTL